MPHSLPSLPFTGVRSILWRTALAFTVPLLAAFAAPPPDSKPPADLDEVVARLAHEDIAVRQKAMKRLEDIGEPAVKALRKAATDPDPDVRLRAFVVLRAIDRKVNGEDVVLKGHTSGIVCLDISADGKRLLTGGNDSTLRLWDLEQGKELRQFTGGKPVRFWACCFAPDGKSVLGGGSPGYLALWETETGKLVRTYPVTGIVRAAAFLPDGKHFLTGSYDRKARLWETETAKEVRLFEGHTANIMSLARSPDGKRMLTGSGQTERTARLWEVDSGKMLFALAEHGERILSVAFAPDGRQVATACWDGLLRLWDVQTGKLKGVLSCPQQKGIYGVAYSADGKLLATGGTEGNVVIWDVATQRVVQTCSGHTQGVGVVRFTPDGKKVVSAGKDGDVRVWRVRRR